MVDSHVDGPRENFANGLEWSTGGCDWYSQSIGPSYVRRSMAEVSEVDKVVICRCSGEAVKMQLGFDGAGFHRVFSLFSQCSGAKHDKLRRWWQPSLK